MSTLDKDLETLVRGLVAAGEVTAAVALVGDARSIHAVAVAGHDVTGGEVTAEAGRFDLASLTKPVAATLALVLDTDGSLPLDTRIGKIWPQAAPELAEETLESLLRHRSGLQPWTPLYAQRRRPEEIPRVLLGDELLGAEPDTYSDLDYILWGLSVRRALKISVAELLRERVLAPLELATLTPSPGIDPANPVVPCPLTTAREVQLAARVGLSMAVQPAPQPGTVQDGNARFLAPLESVPGHSGLFGTAVDVWRLAAEWRAPGRLLSPSAVAAALSAEGLYALGWKRRDGSSPDCGAYPLGERAFGHYGFTGSSVWVDEDRIAVLLAHRTSPFRELTAARQRLHHRISSNLSATSLLRNQ